MKNKYDLMIIGGGPAGMSLAIEAARNDVGSILLVEANESLGGTLSPYMYDSFALNNTTEAKVLEDLVTKVAKFTNIEVVVKSYAIELDKDIETGYRCALITNKAGCDYTYAKAIVLATGNYEKHNSAISLPGKRVNGIHTSGMAQRYLNNFQAVMGKKTLIVGSENIGLITAKKLIEAGVEVVGITESESYLKSTIVDAQEYLAELKIPLYQSHIVIGSAGKGNLETVTLAKVDENSEIIPNTEKVIEADTLFLAVGYLPNNELMVRTKLELDKNTNSAKVNSIYQTSLSGIFVCGNGLHVINELDKIMDEAKLVANFVIQYVKDFDISVLQEAKGQEIQNLPATGIKYIVPQILDYDTLEDKTKLFIKVKQPVKGAKIIIKASGKEIYTTSTMDVSPIIIQEIELDKNLLTNDITDLEFSIE
ncbi:MAG: NAD(P)/FAD-dependent oxidoreductase [Mycoplasmatales bacterium]